jgi:ABC-type amino acid transport substrate-binding protein
MGEDNRGRSVPGRVRKTDKAAGPSSAGRLGSRWTILTVAVVIALTATACGSGGAASSEGDGSGGSTSGTSSDVGLKEPGTLTVGANVAYAPFEYLEGGQPVGFSIDLANEIGERLGLDVRIVDNPSFDALIPALQDGQYDVLISTVTITEEREEVVNFSRPYLDADQSLVVNTELTPDVGSVDDLPGDAVIGVQKNTTSARYAEENLADQVREIRSYDGTPEALQDLAVGRVQGVVTDIGAAAYAAETQYGGVLKVVQRLETGENLGIVVREGDKPMLRSINGALKEMEDDGTLARLEKKWFGDLPGS